MTKEKKESTNVVLTFRKGEDFPIVTMKSHFYIDLKKIDIAKNMMTTEFFKLANAASTKVQSARRKQQIKEREEKIDPIAARLAQSDGQLQTSFGQFIETQVTEKTNG